ncbi:4247_t:CDS:1 [Acaulospora morrowiae]|uniref:4247_t:CDS:1 n=1 Tax=Acaulospora morrowiae TaxID=94023 RepID=A0A9N8ZUW9_9GLOM|nr:4247_t:CDS:1 [Acaulospora morrowiae]
MDIEAKKKHCGLLMFDVPIVSRLSINNDDAGVPPTSNSQNTVGSLEICNQSMPQDCVPRSPNYPVTVLSAGAATGNDQSTVQNAPDSLDSSSEDGGKARQPSKKSPPRPPNAFILYRKAKQPGIIASHKHLTNAEISKKISDMWKSESNETILMWERLADQKKLEHMQTYPNYVYCPNKNRSKVDKRKQRRRSSKKDSPISTGPVRRKSTKNSTEKTSDSPSPETVTNLNVFDAQPPSISMSPQQHNVHSHNDSYTILSSPEIPLFTENPEEFVNSQKPLAPTTPITPITPISPHQIQLRDNEFNKIRQYGDQYLHPHAYQPPQHHHGNNHSFPFASVNGLTPFYNANGFSHPIDPLCCLIPEVIQTQQHMMSEAMLHHDQQPHANSVTPLNGSPASNARTALYQYIHQNSGSGVNGNPTNSVVGNPSLDEILAGFECQNYMNGSANHHQYFH